MIADGVAVRLLDGTVGVISGESTSSSTAVFHPHNLAIRWSWDGSKVVYYRYGGLYTANADGSGEEVLVESGRRGWWSPVDPSVVYFHRRRPGTSMLDVYRINVQTLTETLLLPGHHIPARDEAISPDGSKLFVSGCVDEAACFTFLDLKTGQVRELSGLAGADRPVWSPDGNSVLYSVLDGVARMHVLNVPTGTSKELLAGQPDAAPVGGVWSPDGQYVAFHLEDFSNGTAPRVSVMKADGSASPQFLTEGRWPAWTSRAEPSTGISERSWGETKLEAR